jgi:rhodanese-related sulfurtransferase
VTGRRTIDEQLGVARQRIERHQPMEAAAAQQAGAVLVDTRDSADRLAEGEIPGSVWHPRNVLEWRADPSAELADPRIADLSLRFIVVCNDGYSSSLTAASLVEIGFARAGDLIGGYRAWKRARLPTVEASHSRP